ncbi:MAG: M56 family metallopeptidase [Planctomycetales bacterium]|nr:M56 family metallopeptidase [Planctomycetales bacterium]
MTSAQVFETLASLPLQILVVVIAIAALGRIKISAATRCRLWTIAYLSIIFLIAAAFLVAHIRLLDIGFRFSESSARRIVETQIGIVRLIGMTWLIGCVMVLIRRCCRFAALQRFLRHECRPMTDQELAGLPLTDNDTVPSNLHWLVSKHKHGPFCWQLHRPTIVISRDVLRDDTRTLRHVLLHELEHLRTDHPLQHFLQGICSVALWFHPAIWWAARDAELSREFHCDEVSASDGNSIGSYLRTLTRIAEQSTDAHACTLAFGRRKSAIIRRTERLVSLSASPEKQAILRSHIRDYLAIGILLLVVAVASQIWLPVNVLASTRSRVSPWPRWTAAVLHDWGVSVRDFEQFDDRHDLRKIVEPEDQ